MSDALHPHFDRESEDYSSPTLGIDSIRSTLTEITSSTPELVSGSITPVPLTSLLFKDCNHIPRDGDIESVVLPSVNVPEGGKKSKALKSSKPKDNEKETVKRKKFARKEIGILDERQANKGQMVEDGSGGAKEKRKKLAGLGGPEDGPLRKKSRAFRGEGAGNGSDHRRKKQGVDAKKGEQRRKVDRTEKEQHEVHGTQNQRSKRGDTAKIKSRYPVSSTPTPTNARATVPEIVRPTTALEPNASPITPAEPTPPSSPVPHDELLGMLIESMVTSRASSLPASSLYRLVMQSRPAVCARKSEQEWLVVFESVLEEGWKGCGVFGKVESNGKVCAFFVYLIPTLVQSQYRQDDAGYAPESRWFYVPERDEDQERAAFIRSMMPRPGKRSETKKYKQYYYRPLEKISKWDPEDAL